MSGKNSLRTHRNWEDWLGIALGIVIAFAPWIQNEISHTPAIANAAVAGLIVLMLAELDLVRFRSWPEAGLLIVGLWVAVSPFVLGYGAAGSLRYWHVLCGALVAMLGALGLWQRQSAGR
jgi:hypothetical protein